MQYAIGFVGGLVAATFVAILLDFFNKPIVGTVERLHREIQENARLMNFGPGYIFDPIPEEEEVRRAHIQANGEMGKDTPIAELR